jgi:hypothetical protein
MYWITIAKTISGPSVCPVLENASWWVKAYCSEPAVQAATISSPGTSAACMPSV